MDRCDEPNLKLGDAVLVCVIPGLYLPASVSTPGVEFTFEGSILLDVPIP